MWSIIGWSGTVVVAGMSHGHGVGSHLAESLHLASFLVQRRERGAVARLLGQVQLTLHQQLDVGWHVWDQVSHQPSQEKHEVLNTRKHTWISDTQQVNIG